MNKKDKSELKEIMGKGIKKHLESIREDRVKGTGVPASKTMKTIITIEYDGKSETFEDFLKEKLKIAHDWGLWCNTTFKYSEDEDLSRNSLSDLSDRVTILDKKYNALFYKIAGSDGILGRLSQIETWVKNYEKVKNGII